MKKKHHATDPRELVELEYGTAPNFMTPEKLHYSWILRPRAAGEPRAIAAELSRGRGFDEETIYGVSIVEQAQSGDTRRRGSGLGGCFHGRSRAEHRINELTAIAKAGDWPEDDAE